MKILVIGSGGREHAIAWRAARSPHVEQVFVAPGNAGTAMENKCTNLPSDTDLLEFAKKEKPLCIVGPEGPLAEGIVNRFREQRLKIVGPDKAAAKLEASKAFAKDFMKKYGVRCAGSYQTSDFNELINGIEVHFDISTKPLVLKADGLAGGKGVVVAATEEEAEAVARDFMLKGSFGAAGKTVIVEEFLNGREVSVLAAVSVKHGIGHILPFVAARDHKRRFERDRGPNTGGMGVIAPVPDFTAAAQASFERDILEPTLDGLCAERFDYRGFLFFGLMVQDNECRLLEYNVRLGDPETQAVLSLMEADFALLCLSILDGSLGGFPLALKPGAVCAPVAVSAGYPGPYVKGRRITIDQSGLESSQAKLFFAGAEKQDDVLVTSGGRVLTVVGYGKDAAEARRNAATGLNAVTFEGKCWRGDLLGP